MGMSGYGGVLVVEAGRWLEMADGGWVMADARDG